MRFGRKNGLAHCILKMIYRVAGVQTIDTNGRVSLAGMPRGTSGYVLAAQGVDNWPQYLQVDYLLTTVSADVIDRGGVTSDVAVAKVGGDSDAAFPEQQVHRIYGFLNLWWCIN